MVIGVRCFFSPVCTAELPLEHHTLKAKWLKTPHFYDLFIAYSLIFCSKKSEFSSGIAGWARPMGLGELRCGTTGFELLSHPHETNCSSHWASFQRISWWHLTKFSLPLVLKNETGGKWIFSLLLSNGEAGVPKKTLSLNADPSLLLSSSPLLWPPDHGQHYGLIHHTDGREFGKYVP